MLAAAGCSLVDNPLLVGIKGASPRADVGAPDFSHKLSRNENETPYYIVTYSDISAVDRLLRAARTTGRAPTPVRT